MDFLESGYFEKINYIHLVSSSPPQVDKMITHPIKLYVSISYMMLEFQIKIRQLFIVKVWVYYLQQPVAASSLSFVPAKKFSVMSCIKKSKNH